MAPTLRPHRDFALCRPVHAYAGEGIYFIALLGIGGDFYRVQPQGDGSRHLELLRDNPRYSRQLITEARFDETVMAKVVAEIRLREGGVAADLRALRGLAVPHLSQNGTQSTTQLKNR